MTRWQPCIVYFMFAKPVYPFTFNGLKLPEIFIIVGLGEIKRSERDRYIVLAVLQPYRLIQGII